jgi:hypothetical protein
MKTIIVVNGDLFRIAADHLNDATQWYRIAAANRIEAPEFEGERVLVIPDRAPSNGGILHPVAR